MLLARRSADTSPGKGKKNYGTQWTSAQGLLTGTWVKLLDGSGWIKTTYYYDAYGNMIQKRSTSNKGYDYEYYAYNYNNQVTKKLIEHSAFGTVQPTEEYTYIYGSRLRLETVNYKFNGETTGVTIAAYKYNNLGQVQEKKTGGGKETTAFNYNLRGWETDRTGQKFSENLYYTTNPKSGGATYYGGNISAMTWKATDPTTAVRGYSFTYDALGQLSNAVYGEGTAINTNTSRYDESFTYDKHGNIKTLKRSGLKDNNTFGLIDDLTVTQYYGNLIQRLSDAAGNQSSSDVMEFKKTFTGAGDEYVYGANGTLTSDYNKNICMMKYNYLTLPKSVQFRKGDRIEYVYDAAGVRRQTTHKVANRDMNYGYWSLDEPQASDFITSATVTTNYLGNKVYVNNQLKYIMTEEGYIEKAAGSNTYTAHYYLNDHLGSRRVVMDAAGTVKQVNNFYPSGTSIAEYPRRTDQGVQPWKFESKELDRTNGLDFYDFEARAYDPVLMRFNGADPLAEKYPHISPYVFCANNPVRFVDPTGMDWYWINYDDKKNRSLQYDPNITKDSKLGEGQKYAGVTYQVKDKDGNIVENYRKDGSIMFSNETKAYNRMWNQATAKNVEGNGFALENGKFLVMPDYKNKVSNESDIKDYDYSINKEGKLSNKSGEEFKVIGNVHTHQDKGMGDATPSYWTGANWGDVGLSKGMGGLPVIVIGYDGKVRGVFWSLKGEGYMQIPGLGSRENLLSGKTKLIPWLKTYPTRGH